MKLFNRLFNRPKKEEIELQDETVVNEMTDAEPQIDKVDEKKAIFEKKKILSQKLVDAAINGQVNAISRIIEKGADVNFPSIRPGSFYGDITFAIHEAVRNNHIDAVRVLISHRANLNLRDYNSETPLHIAIDNMQHSDTKFKADEIARVLIDNGADLTVCGQYETNPIEFAEDQGQHDIAEYMRNNKVNKPT